MDDLDLVDGAFVVTASSRKTMRLAAPCHKSQLWLEAAGVGRPDDVLGEVVVAYERLAKYKRPILIEVREELPTNAVGKIDKPSLRASGRVSNH